ncbi:putative nucleoside-diphosphate-sugar epimerase [Aspergillus brunneoviolaceus CBS 621.78]|uniref:Uncharacterized protein n=1 Tax=Aspergillus brunneoviolaceus CBS 621.78 TaxID=1450534 RepID=A0ACD1FWD8_9EURO|nr:hypothetical protein BO95DRAFT_476630 [Aspergillus brunneoviolaceus CBS 621.78]RAH41289.1 hypothetical protein BO95DRAFT_476630 [Aspergillus brunneoviolaceus CBS 621.78]
MKIILAGTTGLVGQEVLTQCLAHPSITSILVLSRVPPSRASADEEASRRVTLEYTIQATVAFNEAFTASLVGTGREEALSAAGSKFRFVYFSGGMAERDQTKSLWVMAGYRRLRGQAEHPATFESYIMRPGMVLSRQGTLADRVRSLAPSVRVDVLARAAVDLAVRGHSEKISENARITE